nr:PREDICTED: chlorophyll a-b binding protein CP26, chloroplastic-like isoform X2 [Musa acuminata subsp. malaccensis]
MVGAAGFIIQEAGLQQIWCKLWPRGCLTGALLLDGNTPNYFGKNSPINLVLVGGAEYYRIINGLDLEDKLHPGGPFDPTGAGR